jgi:hypothetical protein
MTPEIEKEILKEETKSKEITVVTKPEIVAPSPKIVTP